MKASKREVILSRKAVLKKLKDEAQAKIDQARAAGRF